MTIQKYATYNEAVIALLAIAKTKKRSIESISQETGINRTSFYRWGPKSNHKVSTSSAHSIVNSLGYKIKEQGNHVIIAPHTDDDKTQGEEMDTLHKIQGDLIENQKVVIDMQKEQIATLKEERTQAWPDDPAKNKLFVEVIPHCKSTIELKNIFNFNKPIERCITNMHGFEKIAKLLDMPYDKFRDEYFCQGQWHPNDDHPAERLFSKQTTKRVADYSKGAREILRNLKYKFLGYDYLHFYVDYEYKNKVVKTTVAIRLEFGIKRVTAEAKTTIINDLN
mgnify:CR=1 FL=1